MENKEKRNLNIIFSKSGTGSPTTKLCIPISWCYDMNLSKEKRKITAIYDYEKKEIIIKNQI